MSDEQHSDRDVVEMPAPTVAPLVLALGIALAAAGVATTLAFVVVGAALALVGLGMWIAEWLPDRGHYLEPMVEPSRRAAAIVAAADRVERLRAGMPGYRLRLPERVHPISAGIKGGLAGGLIMPLPAMAYGVLSGHGVWFPVNLLAGMVLPGVGELSVGELEAFRPGLLIAAVAIHVCVSLTLGLIYGVLLPALPRISRPLAWGALLMPLLWTAVSYTSLGMVNSFVQAHIRWPWFIVSQLAYGVVTAVIYLRFRQRGSIAAGLLGGLVGGLFMPIPAMAWGWLSGHGVWFPVNLLASMLVRHASEPSVADLEQFRSEWLLAGVLIHAVLSLGFGLALGLVVPRLPDIPAPLAWGGLMMPLLWTAASYGLMGVVNPVLQELVDWPWFIESQFVFGVVAALVVMRSEQIVIPPAGRGPDRGTEFLTR